MSKKLLQAAAGAGGEALYVEDVFSTYLFTGTGTTNNIVNGINLADEGGMVWGKNRDGVDSHVVFDTERGVGKLLRTDTTDSEATLATNGVQGFNSDGFTCGGGVLGFNTSGVNNASWTFRKAPKFFDVVTYTGNGTTQEISHNLGSTPGLIIVKNTTSATFWAVYHRSVPDYVGLLNSTSNFSTSNTQNFGNNTNPVAPTDSVFTVGQQSLVNTSGDTYVAYLFAHDAGGFGDDDESIIKCGSFTTDGSGLVDVDLGFEPQWIVYKRTDGVGPWNLLDNMRGIVTGGNDALINPNSSDAEAAANRLKLNATGFSAEASLGANYDYIYIAIRRPMKTPESGTEVFAMNTGTSNGFISGFPVDTAFFTNPSTTFGNYFFDRLRGEKYLESSSTAAEGTDPSGTFDSNTSWYSTVGSQYLSWMFKRATGFFDVVAYTGDGTATRTLNHNLGAIPELIIFKRRTDNTNTDAEWKVWSGDNTTDDTYFLVLDKDQAEEQQNSGSYVVSSLTTTQFTVRNAMDGTAKGQLNRSTEDYISYLFATLAGVSKVGSYTGTGSNLDVDCGFSAGARFILIKRTDSTGDWYVWDSERGIVAGNDPYLLMNSTAAEVTSTDYIDPLSSGFTVTSSAPAALNTSGGSYLFLAIA